MESALNLFGWLICVIAPALVLCGSLVLGYFVYQRFTPPPPAPPCLPGQNDLKLGMIVEEPYGGWGVSLTPRQRWTHHLVVGGSGTGKSKALASWIDQDVRRGPVIVFDPHLELIDDVLGMAGDQLDEPVIMTVGDPKYAIGFNPLKPREGVDSYRTALALIEAFKKIWWDSWGARMEDILTHSFWAMAETGYTMVEVPRFLIDEDFRNWVKWQTREPDLKYWIDHYNAWGLRLQKEWGQSTLVRVRRFVNDPNIKVIIGQRNPKLDLSEVLASGRSIFLGLSWASLGQNAYLLGALLMAELQDIVLSRPMTEAGRKQIHLYVDEFQEMATETFSILLAQARKFGLSITVATQDFGHISDPLQAGVLANCQNLAAFRCNRRDSELMARELFRLDPTKVRPPRIAMAGGLGTPNLTAQEQWDMYADTINDLPLRHLIARSKGGSTAYHLATLDVIPRLRPEQIQQIKDASGSRYGEDRAKVERELVEYRRREIGRLIKEEKERRSRDEQPKDVERKRPKEKKPVPQPL